MDNPIMVNSKIDKLDPILRVVGLFIIDVWWNIDVYETYLDGFLYDDGHFFRSLQINLTFLFGLIILVVPMNWLSIVYRYAFISSLMSASHYFSDVYLTEQLKHCETGETDCEEALNDVKNHSIHFVIQLIISFLLHLLLDSSSSSVLYCGQHVVVLCRYLEFPIISLPFIRSISNLALALSTLSFAHSKQPVLVKLLETTLHSFNHWDAADISTILRRVCRKLFVPANFVTFWSIKMLLQAFTLKRTVNSLSEPLQFFIICSSNVCSTPLNLVASAFVVYYLSNWTVCSFAKVLGTERHVNLMQSGVTQAAMMAILSVQTDLLNSSTEDRSSTLIIILYVVASSLLQCVTEITEPVVLSLSATRSTLKPGRHRRALLVCAILFFLPLILSANLAEIFPIDFWILIVLSTCVLTSIRVLGILIVHGLFVYDELYYEEQSTDLDDVVYVARSFIKILEFLVAITVVLAGIYESVLGKWNITSSLILLVHCYCNVYLRMQSGWKSFLLRREAATRTEALPTPDEGELRRYNDVCPICYQSVISGKTMCCTPCKHFFHRACLKKWLYTQDKCPMCHQRIIGLNNDENSVEQALHVIQALQQEAQ